MATTDKYDRQLRLWGANGQRALGETTVVLIRATAAGTETLKNLVLPGIGKIVIVDDAVLTADENRSNFFVQGNCQTNNVSRAQVALELLKELNPDVQGEWIHTQNPLVETDIDQVLKDVPSSKKLVIGADLEPPLLLKVSAACDTQRLPLVSVHSYGLIGSVRLQAPPLPVLDPKPDSQPPDLRLVHGFDEFVELYTKLDWEGMDSAAYGHVPYPFLLMRNMEQHKASHNGKAPETFAEKQEFRDSLIKAGHKFGNADLPNFEQARDMCYLAYTERMVDSDRLKELLEAASAHNLVNLQVLLQALQTFMARHDGQAPLPGNIPDMVSSTDTYVQLQGAYQKKAARDLQEFKSLLNNNSIPEDDITTFLKNIHSLDVLVTRTLQQEYSNALDEELVEDWTMATMDPYEVPEHTPLLWYIALRACILYYTRHGRYPGVFDKYELDVPDLEKCVDEVVSSMQLSDNDLIKESLLKSKTKYCLEMARYANAEIHTIASVAGGVASQEAVKMITGQYVPINNTYIYNGIASTGGVYRF